MIRIKLFALFIAFALLALVRPRKCLELLEAADRGKIIDVDFMDSFDQAFEHTYQAYSRPLMDFETDAAGWVWCHDKATRAFGQMQKLRRALEAREHQECTLPPAGWRCTRRAGHDGPCAAVVK